MIWAQTILSLVFAGLVVAGPFENVQANNFFNNLRPSKNSSHHHGKPGNKTHHYSTVTPPIVDNVLYMKYVCLGKQNGLRLPIEGSCTQYLECQKGSTKMMKCKVGEHFSTSGLACIDAKLSNCYVKNCQCCDKQDGLYPDKTNCSNYIVCLEEKAHRQSCGSYLKFNSEHLMCDIPERASCSHMSNYTHIERKIEVQNMKTPMYLVSHRVCQNKSNGITVGIPGSCNKFYLCINGKGYLKSCGHMQFNIEKNHCDGSTRIHCSDIMENEIILDSDEIPKPWLKPEDPSVPQPPHRVPGKPFPWELYPSNEIAIHPPIAGQPEHPHHNQVPIPNLPEGYEKPENLPYHPPNQGGSHATPPVFVYPLPVPPIIDVPHHNEEIIDVPHYNEEIIDPKEYAGLCADQSVGALIAMPKRCNKYIRCRWDWYERRVAEMESCPINKHFNAKSKLCDVPEKAGCVFHL